MPKIPLANLPPYQDMIEHILDQGKECLCCSRRNSCKARLPIKNYRPACSNLDFIDLFEPALVRQVYLEGITND